jgi:hypothetical protein
MPTKSHNHEMYGTLNKMSFCTKGYAEIYIHWPFFYVEKGIWKILRLKIQMVCSCFGAPSTLGSLFFLQKTKILIFGGILKFLELIVFEQILVDLGSFRQFWAMAMPKLHLKS